MFEKILIATDSSILMPSIIRYAATLFPKAEYHVISVVETSAGLGQISGVLLQQFEKMCREADEKAGNILEEYGIEPRKIVKRGKAAREIVNYAHSENIDLLAIGSHSSGIQEARLGKVCEKVLEYINCHVLLLNTPVQPVIPKRILNPTTDSEYSRKGSILAVKLAKIFDAELTCLYVGGEEEARHRHAIEFVKSKAEEEGIKFKGIIGGNVPELEIIEREKDHDLIVGSRGRRGVSYKFRFLKHSLALGHLERRIISSATIPIILTHD